ncbi:hypothetical protein X474_11410 [Dethiosulfatarculus sandiegensis]|uniref:Uncharacterized protein n=1 Tax=Dethiosulfatarculus sandiegensis TaxID=1429043 RepID=A0A0D2J6R0_9BACT|nr:hypothetical protein X474_11410 [Dethiosulfatarculus sandiegensis]
MKKGKYPFGYGFGSIFRGGKLRIKIFGLKKFRFFLKTEYSEPFKWCGKEKRPDLIGVFVYSVIMATAWKL